MPNPDCSNMLVVASTQMFVRLSARCGTLTYHVFFFRLKLFSLLLNSNAVNFVTFETVLGFKPFPAPT
jgi:hypothetical protein